MTYASGKIVVFNGHRFAGPPGAIVYSLENLHAHPEWRVPSFRGQIWDYNKANFSEYPEDANVTYVPVGYHSSMHRFHRSNRLDIDLIFCGALNERRQTVLDKIRQQGFKVEVLHFNQWGIARDRKLGRARLALNIHYYDKPSSANGCGLFESVRVSHLVANSVPVVTENSYDNEEQDGWGLESCSYAELTDVVVRKLQGSQEELAKQAAHCLERFRQKPMILPL